MLPLGWLQLCTPRRAPHHALRNDGALQIIEAGDLCRDRTAELSALGGDDNAMMLLLLMMMMKTVEVFDGGDDQRKSRQLNHTILVLRQDKTTGQMKD